MADGSIYRLAKLHEAGYRIYWRDSSADMLRLQSLVGAPELWMFEGRLETADRDGLPVRNGIRVAVLYDETEGDAANFQAFLNTRVRPNAWQRGRFWRQDYVYFPGCLLLALALSYFAVAFLKQLFAR